MLGQLFVKHASKPLEKMLKETAWSCREVSGSTGQAGWKMTLARSSGPAAEGSDHELQKKALGSRGKHGPMKPLERKPFPALKAATQGMVWAVVR